MDFDFTTTPTDFAADLVSATKKQKIPVPVVAAIQATWDATAQTDPSYEVSAATGDLWTVVRVAAVRAT